MPGRRQQPGPTRQPPQPPLPAALPDSVSWGRGGMTRSGFRHDRMLFVENGYDFSQVPPPPPCPTARLILSLVVVVWVAILVPSLVGVLG